MSTAHEIEMKDRINRTIIKKLRKTTAEEIAKHLAKTQPMPPSAGNIFKVQAPEWSEWRKTTSLWPRKSINGRWIFGRINKRGHSVWDGTLGGRATRKRQFATNKELFTERLKGDA